ncbi:MAG TPA: hypothetical protein VGF43_17010 [Dongiaceae bacterium]|jgi:hypothetical protein
MARKIQSSPSRGSRKTFAALLGNAIFWLVVAIVVPIKAFVGSFPELAAFAPWAPIILYGLAALNFVRALLALRGTLGRVRMPGIGQQKGPSAPQRDRPKPAASQSGLPITRTPTVQRMR